MARTKYGHTVGILLHSVKCDLLRDMDARPCWPCMCPSLHSRAWDDFDTDDSRNYRGRRGYTIVLPLAYGCTLLWTM